MITFCLMQYCTLFRKYTFVGILMNNLRSSTKELEVENQKQNEDITQVKNTLKNLSLQSGNYLSKTQTY